MKKVLLALVILVTNLFNLSAFTDKNTIIVSKDGKGNYSTISEAIASVADNNTQPVIIYVKNGIYKEKLIIPKVKTNIILKGEDAAHTIITYDDYASKKDSAGNNIGTSGSTSVLILCDNFTAESITFENSSGPVGQAVAISVKGDKIYFKNCRFLGYQDTIYTSGNTTRHFFYNCFIQGTVDYIFGSSIALFDSCTLSCIGGGYITAASTAAGQPYGYVFKNCTITGTASFNSVYLGRPWRPNANVVYIQCVLPALIRPEGWHNWGNAANEQTALYSEYNNTGIGAATEKRVKWSKQLSDEGARQYNMEQMFGDWNPLAKKK